ncbi:hypothetical protein CRG98_013566 [Punica granatum]|uniref:Uncharacterized protein n=1 Tax=Punica granatum TaxID=22663 RepID=A0A2I0KC04_PUNGR|nr:hypothetical protein CRG98_013566 [Punica granatum]
MALARNLEQYDSRGNSNGEHEVGWRIDAWRRNRLREFDHRSALVDDLPLIRNSKQWSLSLSREKKEAAVAKRNGETVLCRGKTGEENSMTGARRRERERERGQLKKTKRERGQCKMREEG